MIIVIIVILVFYLLDPPPVSRRGAPCGAAQPPLLGGSSAGPRHCQQAGRGGRAGLLACPQGGVGGHWLSSLLLFFLLAPVTYIYIYIYIYICVFWFPSNACLHQNSYICIFIFMFVYIVIVMCLSPLGSLLVPSSSPPPKPSLGLPRATPGRQDGPTKRSPTGHKGFGLLAGPSGFWAVLGRSWNLLGARGHRGAFLGRREVANTQYCLKKAPR